MRRLPCCGVTSASVEAKSTLFWQVLRQHQRPDPTVLSPLSVRSSVAPARAVKALGAAVRGLLRVEGPPTRRRLACDRDGPSGAPAVRTDARQARARFSR